MPSAGIGRLYVLSDERIDEVVTKKLPGTFALDRRDDRVFKVSRVGRSDGDINARLKSQVGCGYKYFTFGYSASAQAAFEKECKLYHDFEPPDNAVHPDRPEGSNWTCPVEGCDALD
jgi:hypothetical protein